MLGLFSLDSSLSMACFQAEILREEGGFSRFHAAIMLQFYVIGSFPPAIAQLLILTMIPKQVANLTKPFSLARTRECF